MDFVSIVLHELGHGLGFYSSLRQDNSGTIKFKYGTGSYAFPAIYDKFVVNSNGTRLTSMSTSGTSLENFAQGDNIFFDGQAAVSNHALNQNVKLFAPTTFKGGSSISHLDDATFDTNLFDFGANRLMTHGISKGEAIHNVGVITGGILTDIGWDETFPIATGLGTTTPAGEVFMRYLDNFYSSGGAIGYNYIENGTTYTKQPNFVFELDKDYSYNCWQFFSGPSNTDYRLIALHKNGSYLVDRSSSHTFTYDDNILPDDLEWLRDQDGNIKGYLEYIENIAQDATPVIYGRMSVRFEHKPNKPEVLLINTVDPNNMLISADCDEYKLSFVSNGSDVYSVTYQETGDPSTAITFGVPTGTNSVIINGLNENKSYDFSVYASNSSGGITSETFTRNKCKLQISVIDYTSVTNDIIKVREVNS